MEAGTRKNEDGRKKKEGLATRFVRGPACKRARGLQRLQPRARLVLALGAPVDFRRRVDHRHERHWHAEAGELWVGRWRLERLHAQAFDARAT